MTQYRYRITFTRLRVSTFTPWCHDTYACLANLAAVVLDHPYEGEPIETHQESRTGDHHQ